MKEIQGEVLGIKLTVGYATGHVCMDIISCIIGSYMMVFYQNVVGLNSTNVGLISFVAALVGGFSSPIIGFLSDIAPNNWMCNQFGRRKVSS